MNQYGRFTARSRHSTPLTRGQIGGTVPTLEAELARLRENGEYHMMEQKELDAGTIAALMLRLKEYRLPRAKRLLQRVNEGQVLRDADINFLKRVHSDSLQAQSLIKRNPEYSVLVSRTLDLYTEIINKGLENENTS